MMKTCGGLLFLSVKNGSIVKGDNYEAFCWGNLSSWEQCVMVEELEGKWRRG
jgi:hypothetical protein